MTELIWQINSSDFFVSLVQFASYTCLTLFQCYIIAQTPNSWNLVFKAFLKLPLQIQNYTQHKFPLVISRMGSLNNATWLDQQVVLGCLLFFDL